MKGIYKKMFFSLSVVIICSHGFIFNRLSHAESYNEEEILKKQEFFKARPSDLELFMKVKDTTKPPYNAVGTVFVKGKTLATGVLIGKNTIVTNYHIARQAEKNPSNIIFTPGSTREDLIVNAPYGTFEAEEINEHPYGQGLDLAIIKLKPNQDGKSAGELIQPAKIPEKIDIQARDKISLLGYPYNFSTHSLFRSQIELYDVIEGQYFGYTEPGNSGSGIFNLNGELLGIHVGKGGRYNLLIGEFFNRSISSFYSIDKNVTTLGEDLKKRAKLQEEWIKNILDNF